MDERLLIISPVRNEAPHFERVARAMAEQTKPPAAWLVIDDGSTDSTFELMRELEAEIPFMTALQAPPREDPAGARDRLARAAAPIAFNAALRTVDWREFTHVGKLDGDVELPARWFENLLSEFERDPGVGIAGGDLVEHAATGLHVLRIPRHHVHGAVKTYTRDCFAAIGGVAERLGWDTIDETYARMRGYRTRTFTHLQAVHHRPVGSADGTLRGRARHGTCAWIAHFPLHWVTLRALKLASVRPFGVSGAAFLYGYLRAAAVRTPRVDDPEFRRYARAELRGRMLAPLQSLRTDRRRKFPAAHGV